MKNNKKNILLIIILSAIVLYIVFKDNFALKLKYLFSFNPIFLLLAFVLMILYWVLKGLVLYYCTRKFDKSYRKKDGIHLMITTQFFHGITPFATGGQPWQIYKLKKRGVKVGESTNIVIEDFIAYQLGLILLGIIAVTSNSFMHIIPSNNNLRYLVIFGFTVNVFVVLILFLVAFNKKFNEKIINLIIKLLSKTKIIKDKSKMLKDAKDFTKNLHDSAKVLLNDRVNFIRVVFLNFSALIFHYLIPFMLMMGLGIFVNPFYVIISSAYVMLIDSLVPTPGSTGGLEYGFISFFKYFIVEPKLSIVMIVWRIVTYYFGIFIGFIVLNIHKEGEV